MTDFSNTLKKSDMNNENMVNELGCSQVSASMGESSASDCNSNGSQRQGMPCICVFDSIFDVRRSAYTAELVREYLEVEYVRRKGVYLSFKPMRVFAMNCPQQPNANDCGVYLLMNLETFFKNPFKIGGDCMPDLRDWFYPSCIVNKRQEILRIICDLKLKNGEPPSIF
ncbi:hypothetical protein TNCV_4569751 [Trichonephila clavipes]|nr:hypothetical protein TNCV_4569751 [Trichonephila clavipes]